MRKTKPLTKQRFKPQVSAAFDSVSIKIDAYCVCPQNNLAENGPEMSECRSKIGSYGNNISINNDVLGDTCITPDVGNSHKVRFYRQGMRFADCIQSERVCK